MRNIRVLLLILFLITSCAKIRYENVVKICEKDCLSHKGLRMIEWDGDTINCNCTDGVSIPIGRIEHDDGH